MKQHFQKLEATVELGDVKLNADADDSSREPLANAVSGDREIKFGWFPPSYILRSLIVFVPLFLFLSLVVILTAFHFVGQQHSEKFLPLPTKTTVLAKLTFGSCAMQYLPHPFWDTLHSPVGAGDFFIFGGDNVYGDSIKKGVWEEACPDEKCVNLQNAYKQLDSKPSFIGFRKQHPILPIWDDHDFGYNDGGGKFKYKEVSLGMFKRFFDIKENDPRYSQKGLYGSWLFGGPDRLVHVIVLDLRYYKSEWELRDPTKTYPSAGRYANSTDPSKTMLGDQQWKWLESKLLTVKANVCVIASSLQFLSVATAW